jgi:hypothetical protein
MDSCWKGRNPFLLPKISAFNSSNSSVQGNVPEKHFIELAANSLGIDEKTDDVEQLS